VVGICGTGLRIGGAGGGFGFGTKLAFIEESVDATKELLK